jgi:glycosyltransferase involved in cell wall biosynthesis
MTCLISIILPTFNRGWIVAEAIESVLAQADAAFELIVVDDGSADDTPQLLQNYGNRIRVLRQKNRGVSAARNRGIRAATGALIAFLDSDDLWLPGKLAVQVAFFAAHPDALICQTEETWIRRGVRVNPGRRHRKESGMIFERSLHLCLVSPSAVMLRRQLLDQVGLFDEGLPACEDYDLWLRVSCRYPIHLIDAALTVKRGGHADQLSRQPSLDRYRIQSLQKLIESRTLSATQQAAAINVLRSKCRIYAAGCLKRGRFDEGRRYLDLVDVYRPVP